MTPLAALFHALQTVGIGLDAEAARDAVWLAAQLMARSRTRSDEELPRHARVDSGAPPQASETAGNAASPSVLATSPGEHPRTPVVPPPATSRIDRPGGLTAAAVRARIAKAPGLAGERGIPAALRPLRRKVRSPHGAVDEAETVRRVTEDDLWLPAFQPVADRWLELALVVDQGLSMVVWQELARGLRRVFSRAAAFRDVRAWALTSEADEVNVRPMAARAGNPSQPGRAPFGGGRRGLVLVMSDCVSTGWHDGRVVTLLDAWSRHSPVAILQVLPERLWPRTALGQGTSVSLRAVAAATTNPHLYWSAELPLPEANWRSRGAGVGSHLALFPVVTTAPATLRRLARMVAGVSDQSVDGILFEKAALMPLHASPANMADERVRRFWSVASSGASQLASLLAATPAPSTGMLRVLRRELLPAADASVEAEVLFSGLITVRADADPSSGDVPLDVPSDVRSLLLENAPVDAVLDVLRRVAQTTAIPGIAVPTFESWIENPSAAEAQLQPAGDPMAAHVAAVLEQIGGSYARIVHPQARQGPPIPSDREQSAVADVHPSAEDVAPAETETAARGKRTCFVVMGFGYKTDPGSGRSLDLDKTYSLLIKPAVEEAGLVCIRADEVMHGPAVGAEVFRLLLEAELVIADLSTGNPNAIYQLGIRHALRPGATIVLSERQYRLPFDIAYLEVVAYEHGGRTIDEGEVSRMRRDLQQAIGTRLATPATDSPIYTLLPGLNVAHMVEPDSSRRTAVAPAPPKSGPRPTCFVSMGFGRRTDFETFRVLDLDATYQAIIRPAAEEAGFECMRADQITHSGVIDTPLFERLLSADVVIADLSTSNANALYELGVRHALRPYTTIAIAERQFRFPFDIDGLYVRSYEHLGEDIGYAEALRVRHELTSLLLASRETVSIDSPMYLALPGLVPPRTGVPPSDNVEQAGGDVAFGALLDAFRAAAREFAWERAERIAAQMLELRPSDAYITQQLALATYKSRQPDDRTALTRAKSVLERLNPRNTRDVETLGLWAAVHKRLWDISSDPTDLDEAIDAYRQAFELKNDHYNGINLAFLLTIRAVAEAERSPEAQQTPSHSVADDMDLAQRVRRRVVQICEEALAADASHDDAAAPEARFWVKATLVEAMVGLGEREQAAALRRSLEDEAPAPWMQATVASQLEKLQALMSRLDRTRPA